MSALPRTQTMLCFRSGDLLTSRLGPCPIPGARLGKVGFGVPLRALRQQRRISCARLTAAPCGAPPAVLVITLAVRLCMCAWVTLGRGCGGAQPPPATTAIPATTAMM
jgi:hypothetical protein